MTDTFDIEVGGFPGSPGGKGDPGSPGEGYATRGAMAARLAPALLDDVYLTEVGREGKFVVDAASTWTAQITADTAQAHFVVSTADATKVYRRVSFGIALPWAGAKGDYNVDTQSGTDDSAAIVASLAALKSEAIHFSGLGYSTGAGELVIPKPKKSYYIGTTTIDVTATIRMRGPGNGQAGGMSTIFYVAPDTTAWRIQAGNTVGETGTYTPTVVEGGNGSILDGFAIVGLGFNGTTRLDNTSARGIHLRANAAIRNFNMWRLQGPGIEIRAGVGSAELGGANCWELTSGWVQECMYGLRTSLSDTNAGIATHLKCSQIRRWAIEDISGAANTYIAPLTQLCGVYGDGTANNPTSICHQAGVHYAVIDGQETGASTNAPPAGHNDNTWWRWYEDGAAGTSGAPPVTWFSGMHCVSGGPYKIVNGGTVLGAYWEGNQPPSQCGGAALFIGGSWGGNRYPVGAAWINAGAGEVTMNRLRLLFGGITIDDDVTGGLVLGRYNGGTNAIISAGGLATTLTLSVPGTQVLQLGASEVDILSAIYITSTTMNPFVDNVLALGGTGHRYKELWAGSATIQTSDRQHKEQIRMLSGKQFGALLDAVGAVPLVAFKFKDAVAAKGEKARDHYGIVAQDLHDELVKRDLDPFAGGVLGRDPVMEEIEEEIAVEREAMSTEVHPKETIELIDGKWTKRIELVERQVPYYDFVQLHDANGHPIIKPAQPAQVRRAVDPETGKKIKIKTPSIPAQPVMHKVRRIERVTEKQKVARPKLDQHGEQEFIWSVRYAELAALQFAWMQRELSRKVAA